MLRGKWAEDIAASHLIEQGLRILERNYRVRGGEIDLIARDNRNNRDNPNSPGVIVFVEVKQRARADYGSAAEAITGRKIQLIRRVALLYLGRDDIACRFDAVLIEGTAKKHQLTWLENAF
jgi:putative endonuclease